MDEQKNIYFSLDEARNELKRRFTDEELKKKIELEIGERKFFDISGEARAVLNRHLCSPDNGFVFFIFCAKYLNLKPLASEYLSDIFLHLNEEKKGLGRLKITNNEERVLIDIIDFKDSDKKPLNECLLQSGEKLVDFHHNLMTLSGHKIEIRENSNWFRSIGTPEEFYYFLFLHFLAHGVLFETFPTGEEAPEKEFTNSIVIPTIKKIMDKFGYHPIIINLYPNDQTPDEDFFWWSYSPIENKNILDYAKKNNLKLKPFKS